MWVKRASVATAMAVVGMGVLPGVATADPAIPAPPVPAPAPASTTAPAPATAPKTTIDADGTYAVGTDIVPGVYSSAGPFADGTCSWRRTGNPDGATIDNALTHKPQVVQIDPTDKAFKTTGCQVWQLTEGATPDASAVPPALAGLKLQAYLALLNSRAAASGQVPSP